MNHGSPEDNILRDFLKKSWIYNVKHEPCNANGDDLVTILEQHGSDIVWEGVHLNGLLQSGERQPELLGFVPDPWQAEVLLCASRNESALVSAPTSSGKTFLSLQIMRKFISGQTNSVAVFVAPTKALAGMVFRDAYNAFRQGDKLNVVGLVTRDMRINQQNARILITIPEMLDILLWSPSTKCFRSNLACLVVDEVHKIFSGNYSLSLSLSRSLFL